WASTRTLGLFALAAITLVAWVAVERRVASPLVDISMLAKPAIAVTNTAGVLIGFAMYGSFLLMSDFTQTPKAVGYGFRASVPVQQSGIANGMNAVLRTVGGAVGSAVMGAVLTGSMTQVAPGVKLPTVDAYTHGFMIAAVLGLVAAVVPFLVQAPKMTGMT